MSLEQILVSFVLLLVSFVLLLVNSELSLLSLDAFYGSIRC
ncbi:hypothetical protein ACQJ0M_06160 [Peribacillus simplex]